MNIERDETEKTVVDEIIDDLLR